MTLIWRRSSVRFRWIGLVAAILLALGLIQAPSSTASPRGWLSPGETLASGTGIGSPWDSHYLMMQSDGNLVVYTRSNQPIWATMTFWPGSWAVMQTDGNLVVYSPANRPVWSSDTNQFPNSSLAMQNDGNLVVYAPGNRPIWSSVEYNKYLNARTWGASQAISAWGVGTFNTDIYIPWSRWPAPGAAPSRKILKVHNGAGGFSACDVRFRVVFMDGNDRVYKTYDSITYTSCRSSLGWDLIPSPGLLIWQNGKVCVTATSTGGIKPATNCRSIQG